MADKTPIIRAAAAIESTIRSHIVPAVVAPAIAAPTYFGATMPDLARAAFDSIDTDELARALALDDESACFDPWKKKYYDDLIFVQAREHYRRTAEAVKAHLTSSPALAAPAEGEETDRG